MSSLPPALERRKLVARARGDRARAHDATRTDRGQAQCMPTINSPALDPCRDMAFWEVSPALKSEHGAESDPASCSSSPGSEADDDAHEQKSNANGNAKRRTTAKPKRLTEERIGQMVRQLALIRDLWVVASPCCLALAFTALPLLTQVAPDHDPHPPLCCSADRRRAQGRACTP